MARDASSKPLALCEFFDIGPVTSWRTCSRRRLQHRDLDAAGRRQRRGVPIRTRKGAVAARLKTGDLKGRSNIVVFGRIEDLPADSLDVVLTVRNYHDVSEGDMAAWLQGIARALKPGGVLAVVDVRTKPGFEGRAGDLHRIAEDLVVKEVTGAGFTLEERSDMLANPKDTSESSEFENREGTDRMVLEFRKPAAAQARSNASG